MKGISQENVQKLSQKLYKRRKAKNLTADQIARSLRMRPHFIAYIETGMWHLLPSGVNGRSMIRNYAKLLSIDLDCLTDKYRALNEKKTRRELYAVKDIQFLMTQKGEPEEDIAESLKAVPLSVGPRPSQWPMNHVEQQLAGSRTRQRRLKLALAAAVGMLMFGGMALFNDNTADAQPKEAESLVIENERYSFLLRKP